MPLNEFTDACGLPLNEFTDACGLPLNEFFDAVLGDWVCLYFWGMGKVVLEGQAMVHGYHLILRMYGFWLPNDPRGSWSDFVRRWELVRFGSCHKTLDRKPLAQLSAAELAARTEAKRALVYDPVSITGHQAVSISKGFATQCSKSNYTIWACSILPEHTHLVIARHTYNVEQMANLLKGASTQQIVKDELHPFQPLVGPGERPPRMWAAHQWKQFLDSEEAIEEAIQYVVDNPGKEGKAVQSWPFVTAFAGINTAGWTTYH